MDKKKITKVILSMFAGMFGLIVVLIIIGAIVGPKRNAESKPQEGNTSTAKVDELKKNTPSKNNGWRLVTAKEFGKMWSLTVDKGRVYQYGDSERFLVGGSKVYALNNSVRNDGYPSIKEITKKGMNNKWLRSIAALNQRDNLPIVDSRAFKMLDEDRKHASNLEPGVIYALEKKMNLMPSLYGSKKDFKAVKVVDAGHWFRILQRTSKNKTIWYKVEIPIRNKASLVGYFNSIPLRFQHLRKIKEVK